MKVLLIALMVVMVGCSSVKVKQTPPNEYKEAADFLPCGVPVENMYGIVGQFDRTMPCDDEFTYYRAGYHWYLFRFDGYIGRVPFEDFNGCTTDLMKLNWVCEWNGVPDKK